MAHITGGGITDNLPRIFPPGVGAAFDRGAWEVPPLFRFLGKPAAVSRRRHVPHFNMGIGLIVACAPRDAAACPGRAARGGRAGGRR